MSPPIYTPDGTEVSEIVLPDGSTASEVIGPDGNVVFEAGPDIPDSGGTHQWNSTAGSGSTLKDSIGTLDGTINGATWVNGSGGAEGSYLDYNGSGDYTDLGTDSQTELSHFVNSGQGTVFAWINADDLTSSETWFTIFGQNFSSTLKHVFVGYRNGPNTFDTGWNFRASDGSINMWNIYGGPATTGSWIALAGTVDGSTATLYLAEPGDNYSVDQIGSASVSGGASGDLNDNVYIGSAQDGNGRDWNGGIDIGWIDSVARSQSAIQNFVDSTKQYYP